MSKKTVKVDGKTFVVDDKDLEEVKTKEEEVPVDEPKEEPKDEPKDETVEPSEKELDAAADKVVAKLGLDEIKKDLEDLKNKTKDPVDKKKVSELLDLEVLMGKSKDKMTANEKVIGFFQAMIQNNKVALKALAEGVAADGGYLFPDEFRYEVIRDIAEGPYMRGHVTVVPMKRDIMKIPTLESRPKVTWTEENTAKETTTAHFNEATLTVKKMAAIAKKCGTMLRDMVKNGVNSWETQLDNWTIRSQVYQIV